MLIGSAYETRNQLSSMGTVNNAYNSGGTEWKHIAGQRLKAADDDAGNLQPVFLKRLYLLHICIFSFFLFNTSLTTI